MSDQVLQQIFTGIVIAVISTAITGGLNKLITEKINLWLGIASFLSVVVIFGVYIAHIVPDFVVIIAGSLDLVVFAVLLYFAYQRRERFPFLNWRVTQIEKSDSPANYNTQELIGRSILFDGKSIGTAWQFKSSTDPNGRAAVLGPCLHQSLLRGKYRAIYRLKVDNIHRENRPIIDIDVRSTTRHAADKRIIGRTLTTRDFAKPDEYENFALDFEITNEEPRLELKIFPKGSNHAVTLDYIKLSRRLF